MEDNKLRELRQLIDEVMHADTKKDAEQPLRRLEFLAAVLTETIGPYFSGKLGEVIAYAKEASGRVSNKQHWISCVEQEWHVFKAGIARSE